MNFNVDKACKAWRQRFPERSERIVVLRGMLFVCREERTVRRRGQTEKVTYPETAKNLEAMLAKEGAPVS